MSKFPVYNVFCVNVLTLPRVLCQMISFYLVFNHGEVFILRRVFRRCFDSFTHYIYTYRVEVSVDVRFTVSILHSAMRFVFSFHSALYMHFYYSTLFIALFSAVEQTHCAHVNFLCWLLFRYPFHLRVNAVTCERSRSFCQKRRWQVTAKHASTFTGYS